MSKMRLREVTCCPHTQHALKYKMAGLHSSSCILASEYTELKATDSRKQVFTHS